MSDGLAGKLLAIDVDGTLLRSDGSLSHRTAEALGLAADAGAVLTLATGRDWQAVAPLLDDLTSISYSLCINGIEVFRADGFELYAKELGADVARRAVHALRAALPDVALGAGVGGDLVAEPAVLEAMPPGVAGGVLVTDILEALGGGVRDLVVHHPELEGDLDELHRRCCDALGFDGVEVAFTGLPMIEIIPPGAGKHTGLAWLAAHLGVERSDVIAVGDGLNDVAMLRWAGHGVAMAQASSVVVAAADDVAPANDADGLAQWIETRLTSRGDMD